MTGAAGTLREALSLGVDRARLVVPEADGVTPDSAAAALAAILRPGVKIDLVLGGCASAASEEGLVARLTAEALSVPHRGKAASVAVRASASEMDALLVGADGQRRDPAGQPTTRRSILSRRDG